MKPIAVRGKSERLAEVRSRNTWEMYEKNFLKNSLKHFIRSQRAYLVSWWPPRRLAACTVSSFCRHHLGRVSRFASLWRRSAIWNRRLCFLRIRVGQLVAISQGIMVNKLMRSMNLQWWILNYESSMILKDDPSSSNHRKQLWGSLGTYPFWSRRFGRMMKKPFRFW